MKRSYKNLKCVQYCASVLQLKEILLGGPRPNLFNVKKKKIFNFVFNITANLNLESTGYVQYSEQYANEK